MNTAQTADELVADVETGGRDPVGWQRNLFLALAFTWSLYHLLLPTQLPYILREVTGMDFWLVLINQSRRIHLAFAFVLAAMAFPLFKSSSRRWVPWYDWILAAVGVVVCLYAVINNVEISERAGTFNNTDITIGILGMILVGISVYRALGLPLLIVALVFVSYVFFGAGDWVPETLKWKGASTGKALWHFWVQDEGVFGKPLAVSATLIYLFVLFGGILEKAGAGNYFIKLAFSLLGHLRGGPAKAAVLASALSGVYSGSSIANVVTTGTFTIPLMKKTGFSPEKAGAIEVASSTNGQLTPPVMGAAAFLIAEFTGVAYTTLLKHALLPALVSYIALIYIVHLEALKLNLKGMDKPSSTLSTATRLLRFFTGFLLTIALFAGIYFLLQMISSAFPGLTLYSVMAICGVVYLVLIGIASRYPDLEVEDPNQASMTLPATKDILWTGLYYVLPIVILIWCILPTPEKLSPGLAASWAAFAMVFIALTQHPLKSIMRGGRNLVGGFVRGVQECFDGMIAGARSMISIAVATAAAGIIVGALSLTGAHNVILEFVEVISGGNLMVLLVLVALMSLILGMGLPTTANYLVVSALMAPVIVTLGAKSGLIIPVVAAHLFVFYFGILADDTPPVGLAAFAAGAISGGDPIKTGIQGFAYDIRTALLPFLFIFNTELLLMDVTFAKAVFVFIVAVIAMMVFAAATQGYFFAKSRLWESLALLLVALVLFRPGFLLDRVQAPYFERPGTDMAKIADSLPEGGQLRFRIAGPDVDDPDELQSTNLQLKVTDKGFGASRLDKMGLIIEVDGDVAKFDEPTNQSLGKLSRRFDFYADRPVTVTHVYEVNNTRWPKEIFYIPALLLLGIVILFQRRRQTQPAF